MDFIKVYSFAQDQERIEAMQKASTGTTDFGVSPVPVLVGTPQWWRATIDGSLKHAVISGVISRVYWGGMGDWPECEITGNDGIKSRWTREGDCTRYVEGLSILLTYVLHPWKTPRPSGSISDGMSKIVLTVEIEESDRRSDPRAPGPGGVGLRDEHVNTKD
ncbi:hypothetical protein [Radicibacter daui]|uniref:hypothetical protein n=1 Tax=Radicibacter daui TaxID=3064829 RepID=UPI004046AF42